MNAKPRHRAGLFYLRYAAHRTHCLGPFGQRAGIALPPYCPLVSGFFISAADNHLLVGHYILRYSKRQKAKHRKKSEKQIRIEMLLAEGFIEGCLSMLDVRLEMDAVVSRQK
ncbi:hypothetical protein K4M66_001909 [Escherichia coli]|nr:hypothetical protein [Escherichia coli]EFE7580318.1 hypothetical protein [Escherichia coli]EFH4407019.1 hypothetical protein [Escherichia coli]EFH6326760.1 hypothetical protein [Escherichia coli]EFL2360231.1 hypothetical protein [Escherichia coli]